MLKVKTLVYVRLPKHATMSNEAFFKAGNITNIILDKKNLLDKNHILLCFIS